MLRTDRGGKDNLVFFYCNNYRVQYLGLRVLFTNDRVESLNIINGILSRSISLKILLYPC